MSAKPVRLGSSESSNGGTGANAKDMGVNPGNAPGQKKAPSLSAVAKPAKAEAAGNTRSPVAGR
jgi:hypothetical protein